MAICDPSRNPPIPAGLRLLTNAELTPEIQRWAKGYADDVRIPIGASFRKWFGALPVVGLVLCHDYTDLNGVHVPGAYHGVTVFRAIDPAWFPEDATEARGTDWMLVGASSAAIGLVVTGFLLAIRTAGRATATAPASSPPRLLRSGEARDGVLELESDRATLAPRWHPLVVGDEYNGAIRALAHHQSGAYAFRERRSRRLLYVGESHTGRLWKTLLRHVQPGTRSTCTKRDPKRRGGCLLFADLREWTYAGDAADLDVAIWLTSKGDARELEGELIERLEPEHNERGHEAPDDDDDTPF